MQTKDGYELVNEDTTALLEETSNAVLYRLCTAYTFHDYVLRFEVSGDDFSRTFKTEVGARSFFDTVKG
jgi:hypothetical protein